LDANCGRLPLSLTGGRSEMAAQFENSGDHAIYNV